MLLAGLFAGCQKDQLPVVPEAGPSTQGAHAAVQDRSDNSPIISLLPQGVGQAPTQYTELAQFGISYRSTSGSVLGPYWFTRTQLSTILAASGLSPDQVTYYTKILFDTDGATGDLITQVGWHIAQGWPDLPSNALQTVFMAQLWSPGNFEPGRPPGTEWIGCPPGTITNISNAHSVNYGDGIILPSAWFSGVRLWSTCQNYYYEIPFTVGNVTAALLASGMTQSQVDDTLVNFAFGLISEREFWNLVQYKILPNMVAYHLFLTNHGGVEGMNCWRLRQVGLGLNYYNTAASNAIFLIGDASLYCGDHS